MMWAIIGILVGYSLCIGFCGGFSNEQGMAGWAWFCISLAMGFLIGGIFLMMHVAVLPVKQFQTEAHKLGYAQWVSDDPNAGTTKFIWRHSFVSNKNVVLMNNNVALEKLRGALNQNQVYLNNLQAENTQLKLKNKRLLGK